MINTKILILFIGLLIINNEGFTQPILAWSNTYGGSDSEISRDIEVTADGGYIIAGWSRSDNGNVSGNFGDQDGWIAKPVKFKKLK